MTRRQSEAARSNIKKAQEKWQGMTPRQHALAQPEGRARAKPGTTGGGEFFRVLVRPKNQFTTFRYHDIGDPGHIQRLAGRRTSGSWGTHAWLISKGDAHIDGTKLVPDTSEARSVLKNLGAKPVHVKGDVFQAKDRPNVPESSKPTRAQRQAQTSNIKKA